MSPQEEDDADESDYENRRWTFSHEELTRVTGEGHTFGEQRICDIARDYMFPVAYIADVLVSMGASPPIRDEDTIGDLVDGEQTFALLEALNTLDGADLESVYVSYTLEEAADMIDVPVAEVFAYCSDNDFSLPHGITTQLRKDQFDKIVEALQDNDSLPLKPLQSPYSSNEEDDDEDDVNLSSIIVPLEEKRDEAPAKTKKGPPKKGGTSSPSSSKKKKKITS